MKAKLNSKMIIILMLIVTIVTCTNNKDYKNLVLGKYDIENQTTLSIKTEIFKAVGPDGETIKSTGFYLTGGKLFLEQFVNLKDGTEITWYYPLLIMQDNNVYFDFNYNKNKHNQAFLFLTGCDPPDFIVQLSCLGQMCVYEDEETGKKCTFRQNDDDEPECYCETGECGIVIEDIAVDEILTTEL